MTWIKHTGKLSREILKLHGLWEIADPGVQPREADTAAVQYTSLEHGVELLIVTPDRWDVDSREDRSGRWRIVRCGYLSGPPDAEHVHHVIDPATFGLYPGDDEWRMASPRDPKSNSHLACDQAREKMERSIEAVLDIRVADKWQVERAWEARWQKSRPWRLPRRNGK